MSSYKIYGKKSALPGVYMTNRDHVIMSLLNIMFFLHDLTFINGNIGYYEYSEFDNI